MFGLVVMLLTTSCNHCPSQKLGNNFALLEGDKKEDLSIIFCAKLIDDCCTSGTYIVPSYKNHYDEQGNYAEYIERANFDDNWIIAESFRIKDARNNYWIIDKNISLPLTQIQIDRIVTGPFDYSEFKIKCEELDILVTLD